MEASKPRILQPHLPDDITVKHWLMLYGVLLVAAVVPLVITASGQGWSLSDWTNSPAETFSQTNVVVKLLVTVIYLSLSGTFIPMPTGWIIAGLATREAAVANGASQSVLLVAILTTLIVAGVGAIGSTLANLNDYHLFTWMLRHHRIGSVRNTRTYHKAAKWFSRQPFFLILVFNIVPIPVDFVRMLATSHRYPRLPFAVANFLGRFIRYGTIAFITFWWDLGKAAPIALLVLAAVLGAWRFAPRLARKLLARPSKMSAEGMADRPAQE